MKVIEVSQIGFMRLFDRLKGCIRVIMSDVVHPYMTEEERKEAIHKAFNPDVPLFIDYHTTKGLFRITRKSK